MNRIYLFWIIIVTATSLLSAAILSLIEEQQSITFASSQLKSVADNLEKAIIRDYNSKKLKKISSSIQELIDQKEIQGMALCDKINGKFVSFPKSSNFESLCNNDFNNKNNRDLLEEKIFPDKIYYHQAIDFKKKIKNKSKPIFIVIVYDIKNLKIILLKSFLKLFLSIWATGSIFILIIYNFNKNKLKNQSINHHFKTGTPPYWTNDKPIHFIRSSNHEKNQFDSSEIKFNPPTFQECLSEFKDQKIVVIANREPYIHQFRPDGKIEVIRPASGLVTALEPILRTTGGLWIAHGSGSADIESSNDQLEVNVPPGSPKYCLKRIILNKEEELGYYYGFSNEGLWPLCHLAYNRPIFRLSDWEYYQKINQRFTDALPESRLSQDSLILVQDYHYALVPKFIRNRIVSPHSVKVGLFWHIPWPNPEAFGICPWYKDLLNGMLGANVIGFHTQYHCNNFLETCNRYLEARIDWEHFSVTMGSHETFVRAFPIGIDPTPVRSLSESEIEEIKTQYGIHTEFVAVGVDRLDYTKGLVERIEGIERFFEKYPQYIGRFTFVQMGSPSRTHISAYKLLAEQIKQAITRVNSRFGTSQVQPIVFLHQHYEWEQIQYFYQIGDICLVTSLHDGMNLVAKEYIWCQKAEKGALILSKFTGASRELTEAFIINPYSTEELADTIAASINLPVEERKRRMIAMKSKIEIHNAFHWAADLIRELMAKRETFATQSGELDLPDKSASIKDP